MGKQTHFFDNHHRFEQGIEFYAMRYKHCLLENKMDLIVDGTPNYLTYHDRVYNIYKQTKGDTMAKLKIIIVLREPMARERRIYQLKVYDFNKAKNKTNGWFADIVNPKIGEVLSFDKYAETTLPRHLNHTSLDYSSEGRYVDHLRRWFKYFPRHQFLILSHEELQNDPATVQWRVEKFLGKKFTGSLGKTSDDGSVGPRAMAALGPLFENKNRELYAFLNANKGPYMEQSPFPPFKVEVKET